MNRPDEGTTPSPDPTVEAAAAEWLVRHDRGLTPEQQDAFLQWLAAGPAHRASFDRHRRMWADFNALAHWRPEHSVEPNPDLLSRPVRSGTVRWLVPLLAAAAAVALMVWWAPGQPEVAPEPVAYEATDYRQEILPDGTVVDLNRGAHLVLQFTAAARRVVLVQGEAQFAVTKNPARPFVVRAGGVDVRAIGTAFNVKLDGTRLEVLVTDGTVQVASRTPASDGPAAASAPAPAVVAQITAGHRTVIPIGPLAVPVAPPPVVVATSREEVERLLEWQPRLLDFEFTPLHEVAATFNRRNRLQLVFADPELGALPIVASIRSDNVEGFVRLLEATMDIRAERRSSDEIALWATR